MRTLFLFAAIAIFTSSFSQSLDQYNGVPRGFVINKGQIVDQNNIPNNSVYYQLSTPGLNVSLTQNGFSYDTWSLAADSRGYNMHRIDIRLIGANTNFTFAHYDQSEGSEHYYTTGTNGSGVRDVFRFHKVIYQNVYDNIDLEFVAESGTQKPFEYNFILHPGAEIGDIQMEYSGAYTWSVRDEVIMLNVSNGEVNENIPRSYYADNNADVRVSFRLLNETEQSFTVGFVAPELMMGRAFVIDPNPSLSWGTYYGSGGSFLLFSKIDSDNSGIYLLGTCSSTSNIATSGSYQSTIGGLADVAIARFDTAGSRLWATYFGGTGSEEYGEIVVRNGRIVMLGATNSPGNIASPGAHCDTLAGFYDGMIAVFDTSGSRLWSTYFGGPNYEYPYGLDIDANDNIYASGHTSSAIGISTPGSFQPNYLNNNDGFLVKFTPAGTRVWGTYFGGSGQEAIFGMAVQGSTVAVTGFSSSGFGIATPGAHQTLIAGLWDGILIMFDTSGARLWGTYFGGSNYDNGSGICIDQLGNVNITGSTSSLTGIAFGNSAQPAIGGNTDAFLAHFSPIGQCLWSTYIGGASSDDGYSVDTDSSGNILLAVRAQSNGLAGPTAFQPNHAGGFDDNLLRGYRQNGNLYWSTYYGGSGNDLPTAISAFSSNVFFVCGQTNSSSGIATVGSFQPVIGSGYDGFVSAFQYCFPPPAPISSGITICSGSSASLSASGTGILQWYTSAVGGSAIATGSIFTTPILFTTTVYYVQDSTSCGGASPRQAVTVVVQPPFTATISMLTNDTLCTGATFVFQCGNASSVYQWLESSNVLAGETNQSLSVTGPGNYSVIVTSGACTDTSVQLSVFNYAVPVVAVTYGGPLPVCALDSTVIFATAGFASYLWNDGSTADSTFVTNGNFYTVQAMDINGCTAADSIQLNVVACSLVWPGNTNNDTIVDNLDLLQIGLYYGSTGPARVSQGNAWQGMPAQSWGFFQVNGEDYNHVDCDGDGIVTMDDTLAIHLNYGLIDPFPFAMTPSVQSVNPPIYFKPGNTTYFAGDTIDVEVWVGDTSMNVQRLYGIAFKTLGYSPVVWPVDSYVPNNFLCTPGTDGLTIDTILSGHIDIALTRYNYSTRSGYGRIATLRYVSDSAITLPHVELFSFAEVIAVDSIGNLIPLDPAIDSVTIVPVITGMGALAVNASVELFPNPSGAETIITYICEGETKATLNITDETGQLVFTSQVYSGQRISFTPHVGGVYTIQCINGTEVITKRLVHLGGR